jgi:integrase/recombinase XerD
VIPAERIRSHNPLVEQVVQEFERYLLNERALAPTKAVHYASFVRGFLANRFCQGPIRLSQLCAGDVVRFVQRQARRLHLMQQNS